MTFTTLSEARRRLPELVDLAVAGEEILLTRRGHEVARLSGVSEQSPAFPSRAAFRMRLMDQGLLPASRSTIADVRNEER
jgi:prevent-host-death family protein